MIVQIPVMSAPGISTAERRADAAIHLVGMAGAVIGGTWLVARGIATGEAARAVAFCIYVVGLAGMFLASMTYNLAKGPRSDLLRRLDHAAIFLMIAGTYTPYAVLRFPGGIWSTVSLAVWLGALAGAACKLCIPAFSGPVAIPGYLALGWAVAGELGALQGSLSPWSFRLLVAGGVLYTVGVGAYLMARLPFHNLLWHGFVLLAATSHFASIALEFA